MSSNPETLRESLEDFLTTLTPGVRRKATLIAIGVVAAERHNDRFDDSSVLIGTDTALDYVSFCLREALYDGAAETEEDAEEDELLDRLKQLFETLQG